MVSITNIFNLHLLYLAERNQRYKKVPLINKGRKQVSKS